MLNATASGNATYSGSNVLSDGSGNITLFTSSTASFANDNLPTDESDWVGYAKTFGATKEFSIRNKSDVTTSGGNNNGDGIELTTSPFTLNFDNIATSLPKGVFTKLSSSSTSIGIDALLAAANHHGAILHRVLKIMQAQRAYLLQAMRLHKAIQPTGHLVLSKQVQQVMIPALHLFLRSITQQASLISH